jgi:acetoacetyl-CoA synthetase
MARVLWTHSAIESTQMDQFRRHINSAYTLNLKNYQELHTWSVKQATNFWEALWRYCDLIHSKPYTQIVDDTKKMPGATWFSGTKLNFAENLLRFRDDKTALIFRVENKIEKRVSYKELFESVEKIASFLKEKGVKKGDRVAGIVSNMPETVIAMLATVSLGAIWSSCSPDFGVEGIVSRFKQIEPKVVFACNGYYYKNKVIDCTEKISEVSRSILSVEHTILIQFTESDNGCESPNQILFSECLNTELKHSLDFEQVAFDHPIYILYSSGTTGEPKCIVHGTGGVLLQHLKEHKLHGDLRRDDVLFYFTTCGWMMWNWLVSGLAVGSTLILYEGAPFFPQKNSLWQMVDDLGITHFGTSAKYIDACHKQGIEPIKEQSLNSLKVIFSTGSPLVPESFDYVYEKIKHDVQLSSISGGTDIVSCFMLGNPAMPVYRGELQCAGLGMDIQALNESGEHEVNVQGELVCASAFPAQPVRFWNDPDDKKYKAAYFEIYDNIWHHGDYISLTDRGSVIVWGRSDTTLNPGGIRIGTSEIYRVVESFKTVEDSLVVGQQVDRDERVVLFVKMKEGHRLDGKLRIAIRSKIKAACTPRHVPAVTLEVPDIPYTRSGKKIEIAVKKIINGKAINNLSAVANPECLDVFKAFTQKELKTT